MADALEQRVLELVKRHVEGVEVKTVTSRELVIKQHAYEYEWAEYEQVESTEYDDTGRKGALAELIEIGKPAVPTLIKILTSEKGEYHCEILPFMGVDEFLIRHADVEVSKSLIKPFQQKINNILETNLEFFGDHFYGDQISTIVRILQNYPVPEAIPALYSAITKNTNKKVYFDQFDVKYFFNALARIGTKEAITAILEAAKQDAHFKYESGTNRPFAIISLRENMEKNGKSLYKIYRTTEDPETRQLASEALAWRKPIYWLKNKLGL